MEDVRGKNAVLLPPLLPQLPRSPRAGVLATGKHQPLPPSLTDFAAFSSFGSQASGPSKPGSRPCLAPYPKQDSNKIVWRGQPRGKRERLLLTIYSELALVIKTTELPHARAPPSHLASSPVCSNRLRCGHEREESMGQWLTGREPIRAPSAPQRNSHFAGCFVMPGAPSKHAYPSRAGTTELHVDLLVTQ